eukprot:TRINITY_DN2439_c0_g4_i1.p1 TRINITY_DN2439_c0_g4~~TRINITY_DN2439_c0_g4_i1.p1  ORF type:complete len:1030 (+),score=247.38 TRINITY_DN2439_c0_g4_i1:92-3181(+)
MRLSVIFALFGVIFLSIRAADPVKIRWVMGTPVDPSYAVQAKKSADLGVDLMNNDDSILNGAEVELVAVDMLKANTDTENLRIVSDVMLNNPDISGIIGTYSSNTVAYLVMMSSILQSPYIAGCATNPMFSDKTEYPYFGRTIASSTESVYAIADFVVHAGFKRVAFMCADDVYGLGPKDIFIESLNDHDVQFIGSYIHSPLETTSFQVAAVEVDNYLIELMELGTKAIVYSGHSDEAMLFIWRAWKMGLLDKSNSVQIVFTTCQAVNVICPLEECENDRAEFTKAVEGAICAGINFHVGEDWFDNVWTPAVAPEKLTPEEIAIRGTDDWVNDYSIYTSFAHTSVGLMARAQDNFCKKSIACFVDGSSDECTNINKYATKEECYVNLSSNGPSVMEEVPSITFEDPATMTVVMKDSYDRQLGQTLKQWINSNWEKCADWIPTEMRTSTQGPLDISTDFVYSTGTGIPVETVMKKGTTDIHKVLALIVISISIFIALFAIIMLKRDSGSETLRKGKSFFTNAVVIRMVCLCTIIVITQCLRSIALVSPDNPELSIVLEYLYIIPIVILLSGLASRMYRFNRITNNKKMRVVRFSKRHHFLSVLVAGLICIPAIILRIISNSSHIDGTDGLLDKVYILQDDDPRYTFTLTQPTYDLYNDYALVTAFFIFFAQFYSLCLALTLTFLSRMATSSQVKKTNPSLAKEMMILGRSAAFYSMAIFIELVYGLLNHVLSSSQTHSHVGFENGECKASLSDIRTLSFVHMFVGIACWLCFMSVIYTVRLKRFIRKMVTTGYSSKSGTSITNNTNTLATFAHPLSDEMTARLKMTNMTATAATTVDFVVKDGASMKMDRTISYGGNTNVTSNSTGVGRIKTSQGVTLSNRNASSVSKNNTSTISVGGVTSMSDFYSDRIGNGSTTFGTIANGTIDGGSVISKVRRDSALEPIDPKAFYTEMKKLSREDLNKRILRFEAEVKNYSQSFGRLYARFNDLEEKLDLAVLKLEVMLVKSKRLKINSAYVPSQNVGSPSKSGTV